MKLATLCYLRRDNHTLMMHRVKKENDMHAGKWNGLGGKLDLNLWEGDRVFLPWLDQPEFFSGKFIYEEGEFVNYEVVFYPAS